MPKQLNIKWFGAKGDGTTDDTASFVAALADAFADGKELFIPAGVYRHGAVTLTAPIRGEGRGTILEPTASLSIASDNIAVSDLRIRSQTATAISTTNTLLTGIVIENVEFEWAVAVANTCLALDSSNTEGLVVRGCKFFRGGIQATRANNSEVVDNYFDMAFDNNNECIHFSQFSRGVISRNTIIDTKADAIDVFSSGERCVISDNRITGIGLIGSNLAETVISVKIELVDGAGGSGAALGWVENTVITGNIIRDYIPGSTGSRWFGILVKYIDSRAAPAFALTDSARNIVISNNIIDGFWTTNPSGFASAYFAGIHFDGYGAIIEGNHFSNISNQANAGFASETCGVELGFNTPATGIKAIGCIVANNVYEGDGTGIIIFAAEACVISGNVVQKDHVNNRNPRYGLHVKYGAVTYCSFQANSFNLTFANPQAIVTTSSGSFSYCSFVGNTFLCRSYCDIGLIDHCSFSSNQMGAISLGVAGTQLLGNVLSGNHFRPLNPAFRSITMLSQKAAIITGNYFNTGVFPVRFEGTGGDQTLSNNGIVKDNISEGMSGGGFVEYSNVDAATQGTFIVSDNKYNGAWVNTGVINVRSFGATGDGTTDDTVSIAAAITAASAASDGMIFFPAGTYKHTGIVAVSNVILTGEGSDKTKLSYVGTGSAVSKGAAVTSIFRFGMRDLAVVQATDGQGGIGINLDSFQYADFYNVTVATFRNAGDTGIGVRMVNTHAVCAFNRFIGCTIENCDTALLQDSTNATFATGFSYFAGLTIYQEHNCVQLKNTLAGGGSYNVFVGLQIQGNGASAGTGKVIYIEGLGNAFYGIQVDAPGPGNILEFNKAGTSGNIVEFIGGFDPAKYLNSQSSGAANQVQIPGYFSYSPGKKFIISDPIGQLDVNFQSAASNGLDIQLGNQTAGASEWRIQMQASATPYLRLGTAAGVINEWKFTYHKWFVSALEKMRLVAGGLVIEPGNITNDPDAAAAFEVRSTTKGTMPCPVMTKAQRDAIAAPPNGLTVYQTDGTAGLKCRVAGAWVTLNTTADP